MELIVFLSLVGLASIFVIATALSKDRTNLLPAGFLFLMVGIALVTGTGLEIKSGISYNHTEIGNETVIESQSTKYQEINYPVDSVNFSKSLGTVLMALSMYFFVIAGAKNRLRTLFR